MSPSPYSTSPTFLFRSLFSAFNFENTFTTLLHPWVNQNPNLPSQRLGLTTVETGSAGKMTMPK